MHFPKLCSLQQTNVIAIPRTMLISAHLPSYSGFRHACRRKFLFIFKSELSCVFKIEGVFDILYVYFFSAAIEAKLLLLVGSFLKSCSYLMLVAEMNSDVGKYLQ